ncbi:MAG: hypothetical protein H6706_03530 [Myxococcales bacterium]|nr:hypothetical protein [Myxococcales bacterium]
MSPGVSRRDGHATDLALERLHAGELTAADFGDHLDTCAVCQGRLRALGAFEVPALARRPRLAPWMAAGLAAAAAVVLLLRSPGDPAVVPDAGLRLKGGFAFEVFVHDGATERRAGDGEAVHPGDRLGFRVHAPEARQVLIAGIDAQDDVYLCFPQQGGGASRPFGPTTAPTDVGEAVRLDARLGTERLVALACEAPVRLADVEGALRADATPPGCARRVVRVVKAAP